MATAMIALSFRMVTPSASNEDGQAASGAPTTQAASPAETAQNRAAPAPDSSYARAPAARGRARRSEGVGPSSREVTLAATRLSNLPGARLRQRRHNRPPNPPTSTGT